MHQFKSWKVINVSSHFYKDHLSDCWNRGFLICRLNKWITTSLGHVASFVGKDKTFNKSHENK